ncbi:NF-kappa-B essential modulator isoform X2 [Anopheles bellator]|uniref:NF-kappa-B essential modulator isoform X2 n=1 Tax=Anopheles bellator TaxID=139047 RepID=UPI0026480090|nr:NF-kappa-B essential modulator isoform X2 [Anopheles bellator]
MDTLNHDEESFIILGTSPTPSMDPVPVSLVSASCGSGPVSVAAQEKGKAPREGLSKLEISTQLDSTTFSLVPNGAPPSSMFLEQSQPLTSDSESLKLPLASTTMNESSLPTHQQPKLRSIKNKENHAPAEGSLVFELGEQQQTASFVLGETRSLLLQFPSLAQASMTQDELRLLQKLSTEHSQLKESLQRANIAMRKNFVSIQQLQEETKIRRGEQDNLVEQQQHKIDQLGAEVERLTTELGTGKALMDEHEVMMENERREWRAELDEIGRVRKVEQSEAQQEVDELRKLASERQAIIQNLAKKIEDLELQIKGFVVVTNNSPERRDVDGNFIAIETHREHIKKWERAMSVEVAKNLEFEDMRKLYVDEINCLKANVQAAEKVYEASRVEAQQFFDDLKQRDFTIQELRADIRTATEQIGVLKAQSDIFLKDFEAERVARQELASEKSRILGEFEVLQRRNRELLEQIAQSQNEQQHSAQRAAKMVQEATAKNAPAAEEEEEKRTFLRCPLCLKGFKDFGTLQNHASDCMGSE